MKSADISRRVSRLEKSGKHGLTNFFLSDQIRSDSTIEELRRNNKATIEKVRALEAEGIDSFLMVAFYAINTFDEAKAKGLEEFWKPKSKPEIPAWSVTMGNE